MAELRKLVSDRGYIKGAITRMEKACLSKQFPDSSLEALLSGRACLKEKFKEYEALNKNILYLDEDDDEDYEVYEGKFAKCITLFDTEINKRQKNTSTSANSNNSSNNSFKKLPQIDIKQFNGKNIVDYIPFINLFKAVIHTDTNLSHCQKLYYLRTFLAGEALDLIKNLPLTDENYQSALDLLEKRYNNVPMIVNHHINSLVDLPSFSKCTAQNLRSIVSTVNLHITALKNLNLPVQHWDALLVNILSRKVDAYTIRGFHLERDEKQVPSLSEFIDFLDKRAVAMENTAGEKSLPGPPAAASVSKPWKADKPTSHVAASKQLSCKYCQKSHRLFECAQFKLAAEKDRREFVKNKNLCILCLNEHRGKCTLHLRCIICHKAHNTLLHSGEVNTNSSASNSAAVNTDSNDSVVLTNTSSMRDVLLPTAVVRLIDKDGKFIHARALLDSGSQVSFITEKLADELGSEKIQIKQQITGITGGTNDVKQQTNINVFSSLNDFKINVSCCITKYITCDLPQQTFNIKSFHIPSHAKLADKNFNETGEISLLLGCDIFFQVLQRESLPLTSSGPFLINTSFGYVVAGSLPISAGTVSSSNFCITVRGNDFKNTKHDLQQNVFDDIHQTITQFWECEKVPNIYKEGTTENELAEECFQNSVKLVDNKFSVALPLKVELDEVQLGDSFNRSLQRFNNLEKRFSKDKSLHEKYIKFMQDYIDQGHANYYDISNYDLNAGNIYFLPHHPVINPNSKTTPVRAVFDASMKTSNNLCLNDIMLNGPVVQNELFEILILFRTYKYVLLCDIKAMYRGILVDDEYCCLQNILWRQSSHDPVQCLQLRTVTYGMKSSAFLATRCLIELAEKYKDQYPLASFALKYLSYVDDIQCGSNELSELYDAKNQLIELLSKASFSLHKWCSNNSEILKDFSPEIQQLNDKDFDKANTYVRTLGLTYDVKTDTLNMKCPVSKPQPIYTKRQMLSFISKFFDPLGLVGPILVQAKLLMQQVWLKNLNWDDVLPQTLNKQMVDFANSLISMACISVPRNINVQAQSEMELIGYADASNIAHGCCLYLRVINEENVNVNLMCSKSRINPKDKNLTTPRLELNSALLLAMLARKVSNTLTLKYKVSTYLYLDSKIVLSWLKTEPVKLSVYVANRVEKISQLTKDFCWNYVSTKENPADCLSRGIEPQQLKGHSLWFHGPQYLQNSDFIHCSQSANNIPESEIPELKTQFIACNVICNSLNNFHKLIEKYSNIEKVTRIMAYVKRFVFNCKKENVTKKQGSFCPQELDLALHAVIKIEQEKHFSNEFKCLRSNVSLKSGLISLNPFIDGSGLLRVGGRLQHAVMTYQQKHPIILPKSSHLTKLLISQEHIRLKHAGSKLTLSSLNERFWIINANREVKSVIHKCVICFRLKSKNAGQLMGSLPLDRVNISRPFQVVGTDYAGPFNVKQTRIRNPVITKAYVVIFICFITKAIHVELASDMTTQTFLACLKRFISRRNKPTKIYCDNGSYFKGANNVLKDLYDTLNSTDHQNEIINFSNFERISFHFIPSYSPVFGGLWEAGIKSIKYHMKRVIGNTVLTYEELYTVIVQIEGILNSRPLTPVSRDTDDMTYLTPGHFLTGAPLTSYPELNVMDSSIGKLSFWKQCTQMQQHFWRQWYKQYLTMLQSRPKWRNQLPNLEKGAMVLLKVDNMSPLNWPVGRIVDVLPGKDNLVRAIDVKTSKGSILRTSVMKVCPFPIDYD